jgi:hypothetical protein
VGGPTFDRSRPAMPSLDALAAQRRRHRAANRRR